jgi:hypothetical protein
VNTLRKIPAETYRHWARCFKERTLHDEYADELAHLLFLLASNAEFHEKLSDTWDDWYEGPVQ